MINYFGGKRSTAHKYPKPVIPFVIEPFAGGAGYSLMYRNLPVLLCELDIRTVNAWNFIIHNQAEHKFLSKKLVQGMQVTDIDAPPKALDLLRFAAHSKSLYNKVSQWAAEGWPSMRKRIIEEAHTVEHWQVVHGTYELLSTDTEATWFVDPPYQVGGSGYRHHHINYKKLAAWCRSLNGHSIVVENHPATWLPFKKLYSRNTQSNKHKIEMIFEAVRRI